MQPLTTPPRTRSTPGSPACAATSGPSRTNIRKVEIDHDHGAIVKLNPLAEWTEEEVWDYVARATTCRPIRSTSAATRRSAARPARARSRPGEAGRAGRWWWETNAPKECGIHCAIETGGLEHELHALLGEDDDRWLSVAAP